MPCDGSWPREQIMTFSAWIEGGNSPEQRAFQNTTNHRK